MEGLPHGPYEAAFEKSLEYWKAKKARPYYRAAREESIVRIAGWRCLNLT